MNTKFTNAGAIQIYHQLVWVKYQWNNTVLTTVLNNDTLHPIKFYSEHF